MKRRLGLLAAMLALALAGCGDNLGGSACGDGNLDEDEACDDGNTADGDGCSSTCQPEARDEVCSNGVDDDLDGAVDCSDDDCAGDPACFEANCSDGADDDGDGAVDCADPDCAQDPACSELECSDGVDDDGDGAIDCLDPDCAGDGACAGFCIAPIQLPDPSMITEDTTDSVDIASGTCQEIFGGGNGGDVAYEFTPMFDVLDIVLSSATDQGVYVRTVCDDQATEFACADFFLGGGDEVITAGVVPDQPVIVIVSAFQPGEEGPFTLDIRSRPSVCGDGVLEGQELCDDGNTEVGDGCDDSCAFEFNCGDGATVGPLFGGNEECDDGNTADGDGCSATCTVENTIDEVEPNEDGTPELGGAGFDGNDFSAAMAQGPFTGNVIIDASIAIPANGEPGDEDVYEIVNNAAVERVVFLDVFGGPTGFGEPCREATDTVMQLRDAMGNALLDINQVTSLDDRDGAADRCSAVAVVLPPAFPVFAHIIDFSDDDVIDKYWFSIRFTECGDGVTEGVEECDDGNTTPGDGCDANCVLEAACGDGTVDPGEQCDDGNTTPGDGCAADCTLELVCGDGVVVGFDIGGNEECDDGNTTPGDGCDAACLAEHVDETEPNEDGTPSTGGVGPDGNDFASVSADGPFSTDTIIQAAFQPAGDEDVFEISNPGLVPAVVQLETFKQGLGIGVSCGGALDTVISVRDAAGTLLARGDDKPGELCSFVSALVPPGGSVFAHVTVFGDADATDPYFLVVRFPPCGDGVLEAGEECDDGNTTPGDGCDASCQVETNEVEPNDDAAGANPFVDPFVGRCAPAGDVDFVSVAATAGQTITAETVEVIPGACASFALDSEVAILDVDGTTELAVDDDSGGGFCSLAQVVAPSTGTFFIRVNASPFDPGALFVYQLLVTVN